MTDAEIKKGLECCIIGDCQGCIYGETDQRHCKDDLMQNALDLINRQQAEIERLQKETDQFADIGKMHSEIKAETIKEFAERLKDDFPYKNACYTFEGIAYRIDNLVKEMAGDAE